VQTSLARKRPSEPTLRRDRQPKRVWSGYRNHACGGRRVCHGADPDSAPRVRTRHGGRPGDGTKVNFFAWRGGPTMGTGEANLVRLGERPARSGDVLS
jgi:hypothetical protein